MTATVVRERRRLGLRGARIPGAVPPIRTILRWLYVGRLSLALGVFLGAAFAWWRADLTELFLASLSATLALGVTGFSLWYSHFRTGHIGTTFLYAQGVFDVFLVTAVVHIGGPESFFAALYILVIAVNAVMMPFANGMLVALLAGILYVADVIFGHPVDPNAALLLQVAVYWLVAVTTGYLASRVRVAGAAHQALTEALRRARLEASDILRNIRTGILTVEGDGRLVYANPTAEQLLGFDAAAMLDKPMLEQLDVVAPVLARAIRRTVADGHRLVRHEGEATVGGRSYPLGVSTTAVHSVEGAPPSVTAIFKDISDEKRLEQLHLRAERLEAVSEIAASLAHEIKNPLASIRSAVEQLSRPELDSEDEQTLARLVLKESDRLSRLLSEFIDFSRVRVTNATSLDLVEVVEAGVQLARQHPDCPADALVSVTAPVRPLAVEGDEDLLHRVVFNLVLNAVQAGPGSSEVIVEVGPGDPSPLWADLEEPRVLRVRDRGPGIDPDVMQRLFQPFVSGRPGGSGLGLAIVQRATQAHRGRVLCESEPGEGTTFTVVIPARVGAEEVV